MRTSWFGGCYSNSNMTKYFEIINSYKCNDKMIFVMAVSSIILTEVYYQNSQHVYIDFSSRPIKIVDTAMSC